MHISTDEIATATAHQPKPRSEDRSILKSQSDETPCPGLGTQPHGDIFPYAGNNG